MRHLHGRLRLLASLEYESLADNLLRVCLSFHHRLSQLSRKQICLRIHFFDLHERVDKLWVAGSCYGNLSLCDQISKQVFLLLALRSILGRRLLVQVSGRLFGLAKTTCLWEIEFLSIDFTRLSGSVAVLRFERLVVK